MIQLEQKLSVDSQMNAAILVALLPPIFVKDFKIQKDGIVFLLKGNISLLQEILEKFLSALSEVTQTQFYFEIIQHQEVILKIYGSKDFQFNNSIIFGYPKPLDKRSENTKT
ncbi:MAG: hypothetical protein ACFE95_00505 [Candidatus Hodarchaeota archaeon]